jgi:hypothetical protein
MCLKPLVEWRSHSMGGEGRGARVAAVHLRRRASSGPERHRTHRACPRKMFEVLDLDSCDKDDSCSKLEVVMSPGPKSVKLGCFMA